MLIILPGYIDEIEVVLAKISDDNPDLTIKWVLG